jgi:large subunit ribosomal protein L3
VKALIGRKAGMTHIYDEAGISIPVTVLEVGPCRVTQIRTKETDGYTAIQLGWGEAKRLKKAEAGHQKAAKAASRHLREVRVQEGELDGVKVGDDFNVTLFSEGDLVRVIGTSKGKGFAGTIKRHNFSRGPMTHGSRNQRRPGSIGAGYPQHVIKGMKMAGRMGSERTTTKNLKVVGVDKERGALLVRGAVPGPKKGLVMVQAMPAPATRGGGE